MFDLVLFQACKSISSVYLQYKNGGFEQERWESEMRIFEVNYKTPGGRASRERQKSMLDESFQQVVEARILNQKNLG